MRRRRRSRKKITKMTWDGNSDAKRGLVWDAEEAGTTVRTTKTFTTRYWGNPPPICDYIAM